MRRVVQISDIHFGNNDISLLAPLREAILALEPHVLVISGDLVEHATVAEFIQARDFLTTLPKPQIVVPGNHDLPFYNFFERAVMGLSRYKKFITADTSPEYRDEEIFIVGANTSRVWPIRGGSLSSTQLERLEAQFSAVPEKLTRVLVTHHPFDLPEDQESGLIVGHARRSIAALAPFVDVLMAGHIHLSSSGSTAARYKTQGHALAFVQAGTCVSNRNKGENNSFNFMRVGDGLSGEKAAVVERYSWDKQQRVFKKQDSEEYQLGKAGWARCEANKEAEVVAATPTEAP
jgi:3',5'-cyclic AMP phosphodiesterase CpdA